MCFSVTDCWDVFIQFYTFFVSSIIRLVDVLHLAREEFGKTLSEESHGKGMCARTVERGSDPGQVWAPRTKKELHHSAKLSSLSC